MKHAPYSVVGGIVIISGKTTKTACGRRVSSTELVRRSETECPDCKKQIEEDATRTREMMSAARELGLNVDPDSPPQEFWLT